MQGYVDLPSYKNSLKVCQNYVPLPQGSVARRPGSYFVSKTKDNGSVRLVPFNFGQGQSYILEFGNLYVRFYRTDAVLTTSITNGDISSVNTTTNTITLSGSSHGLSTGDEVYLTLGTGAVAPGGLAISQRYFIHYVSGADIRLSLSDNTLGTALNITSAGSGDRIFVKPLEVTTTYTTSNLDDLYFTQSADVLFIAHPDHTPRELKRTADTTWALSDLALKDGPYLPVNTEDTTLTISLTTAGSIGTFLDADVNVGTNTITLTAHGLADDQLVRLTNSGGALPGGLSAGTDYYVISSKIDSFKLSASMGSTAETISSASGGGTHTVSYYDYGHALAGEVSASNVSIDDEMFTLTNHPLVNGQQIFIHPTDASHNLTGPTLDKDNLYYIIAATTNTFKISTSISGAPVALGGASLAGDFKIYRKFIPKNSVITIDASSTTGINSDSGFTSDDVNRLIRLNLEVAPQIQWGYAQIASRTDADTITATVKSHMAYINTTAEWQLGSFSTESGYPRTVQIYQQRLVFAGTSSEPQTVHFSKSGDFDNFAASEPLGVQTGNFDTSGASIMGEQIYSDNSISLMISSDTVDKIEWLQEGRRMTIGTSGGIFQMFGNRDDTTITPFSFSVEKISNWQAHDSALPAQIGNNMVYVQKNGRKVRELVFDREQDKYSAKDITLRAEDVTQTGITGMVFQDQPASLIWCIRTDGKLVSCTYNLDLNMASWAIHSLGGTHTDTTYGNHAKVDALTVIPRGTYDQLWMVAKRHVDEYFTQFAHTAITDVTDKIGITSHGMSDLDAVKMTTDGTMPTNLTSGTTYYVFSKGTNDFQLTSKGIATVDTIAHNSDHTEATYTGVSLTGGTGSGAIATVVVNASSQVASVTITTAGTDYVVDDTLTISKDTIGGAADATCDVATLAAIAITQGSGTHTLYKIDSEQYFIEYLEQFYDSSMDQGLAHYVDCGSYYSGSSASTLTGLNYIEGEEILVLGNNAVQPGKTILAGSITPDLSVTTARIGLVYNSDIQTLPLAIGDVQTSTSIGNKKRIHRIVVKLLDSMSIKYGMDPDDLTEEVFRSAGDAIGAALSLFTGDRELAMPGIYDTEGKIYLRQDAPYPSNILMIAIDYETNE